jgi:hypothetical protein
MAVKNFMVYIKTNFGVDAQKLVKYYNNRLQFAFKQQSPDKSTVEKHHKYTNISMIRVHTYTVKICDFFSTKVKIRSKTYFFILIITSENRNSEFLFS